MIKSNRIRCLKCKETIESVHTHDFVSCRCGAVSADGGKSYLRRVFQGGNPEDCYVELSEEAE